MPALLQLRDPSLRRQPEIGAEHWHLAYRRTLRSDAVRDTRLIALAACFVGIGTSRQAARIVVGPVPAGPRIFDGAIFDVQVSGLVVAVRRLRYIVKIGELLRTQLQDRRHK